MSDRTSGDDEVTAYYGTSRSLPFDLEELAADSEGVTCHVCDAPATVIVEMLDPRSNIGSAIYLCDEDFQFASTGDRESLSIRLAANYEEPVSDCIATAKLMTDGTGRSVRLRHRESD
ncbi:MAG: hypothetical protein JWR83_1595 [Aeromicrobium sp.]|nr:hypothetical protein [Aeromicrobium sp.]